MPGRAAAAQWFRSCQQRAPRINVESWSLLGGSAKLLGGRGIANRRRGNHVGILVVLGCADRLPSIRRSALRHALSAIIGGLLIALSVFSAIAAETNIHQPLCV